MKPFERFKNNDGKRFYFNLYLQDEDKTVNPRFIWKDKDTGDSSEVKKLEGLVTAITFKDREFEIKGKTMKSRNVSITLQDEKQPENFYIIRGNFTGVMRNILNSFASQKELGFCSLSLYVNKSGYASVGVYNRGDMMDWKLSFEEQKALMRDVIDTETGEKLKTDYSKLDAKLEELVLDIPLSKQLPFTTEEEREMEETMNDEEFGADDDNFQHDNVLNKIKENNEDNETLPF